MTVEQRIDELIEAGLRPLGFDFCPVALQYWRRRVFDYMTALYGRITFTPDIPKIAFAEARSRERKSDGGKGKVMEIKLPRRGSDILKTTVENRHGEKLGTIRDFIVGMDGRVKYAILSHGGFLGIGDVLIPIPFDALMTGGEKGTVLLDIDKQTLERALNFESKTWPDFTAAVWEEKIDRYFAAYAAGVSQQQPVDGSVYRDQPRGQI
jgi:hypothetical protein